MANASFKWNNSAVNDLQSRFWQGMVAMSYDIANHSRSHSPVLTGNLKASVRVQETNNDNRIEVVAGGITGGVNVPYARRRNFENEAHPSTTHYMEKGLDDVIKGDWKNKYFKGVAIG